MLHTHALLAPGTPGVLEQVQHRPVFVVDEVVGLEAPPTAARRRG